MEIADLGSDDAGIAAFKSDVMGPPKEGLRLRLILLFLGELHFHKVDAVLPHPCQRAAFAVIGQRLRRQDGDVDNRRLFIKGALRRFAYVIRHITGPGHFSIKGIDCLFQPGGVRQLQRPPVACGEKGTLLQIIVGQNRRLKFVNALVVDPQEGTSEPIVEGICVFGFRFRFWFWFRFRFGLGVRRRAGVGSRLWFWTGFWFWRRAGFGFRFGLRLWRRFRFGRRFRRDNRRREVRPEAGRGRRRL